VLIWPKSKKFFSSPVEEKQLCKIGQDVSQPKFIILACLKVVSRIVVGQGCIPRPLMQRTKE